MLDLNKSFNDHTIRLRLEDGYISITDMAKAMGKRVNDWMRLSSTEDLLTAASEMTGLPPEILIITRQKDGSWVHPDLAIQFAQWCNPRFALQVSLWVRELMTTGKVELKDSLDEKGELKTLRKQYEELEQRNANLDQFAAELMGENQTLKEINEEVREHRRSAEEAMDKALDRSSKLTRQTVMQEKHGVKMHQLLVAIHECSGSRKKADKDRLEIALEEIANYMQTGEL